MMTRYVTMLAAALTLTGGMTLVAQNGSSDRMTSGNLSSADRNFMMKAAQGGMAEVKLGELAKQNGQSQAVKDFGQRMVDDHSKANDQLKSVAGQLNVTLPNSLDAKDQATYDRLSKLNGVAFDKAYIRDMVSDHKKDIAEFQKEANSGSNADVKNFASQTLPTLKEHLSLAEKTDTEVRSEK